jgi:UDP-N-acetylmuramate: L-alanyl-gamma-D-glutamyl-meso-diaminopimelate ligase
MHIHILGIGGTFMAGLAVLAKTQGHRVTGSDAHVYPPMSSQLEVQGVELREGYFEDHLRPPPDLVVIGNAMSRGVPAVEYVLNEEIDYTSGPRWLAEHVLKGRRVIAVAGTHGKTTTASLLAWILEYAGLAPGFLIGGLPRNFGVSARLGEGACFVVEADEYDTAFFDKRSKFLHYRPRILLLNNLEYDHADIFPDLEAIKRQFHHLVRTVPGQGLILAGSGDQHIEDVLAQGCWTPVEHFGLGGRWSARLESADGARFTAFCDGREVGRVAWELTGRHNVHNAMGALAAAVHAGVAADCASAALGEFRGVRRRLERSGEVRGVTLYDDFAHHPTAIASTLEGLRGRAGNARLVVIFEPRSNTMRLGVHRNALVPALALADEALLYRPPSLGWDLAEVARALGPKARVFDAVPDIVEHVALTALPGDQVVIMSNGPFEGIRERLLRALDRGH